MLLLDSRPALTMKSALPVVQSVKDCRPRLRSLQEVMCAGKRARSVRLAKARESWLVEAREGWSGLVLGALPGPW